MKQGDSLGYNMNITVWAVTSPKYQTFTSTWENHGKPWETMGKPYPIHWRNHQFHDFSHSKMAVEEHNFLLLIKMIIYYWIVADLGGRSSGHASH